MQDILKTLNGWANVPPATNYLLSVQSPGLGRGFFYAPDGRTLSFLRSKGRGLTVIRAQASGLNLPVYPPNPLISILLTNAHEGGANGSRHWGIRAANRFPNHLV